MGTTVLENKGMKRFLIQIPENQSSFFMELMQQHNLQVELEELSDADEEPLSYSSEALRKVVLQSEDAIRNGQIFSTEEIRAMHPRL
jgi:hypothetical protein